MKRAARHSNALPVSVFVAVSEGSMASNIRPAPRCHRRSCDPCTNQPYHHASRLELSESDKYLANCTAASSRMALMGDRGVVLGNWTDVGYRIVGCWVVLLASGRPLPALAKILVSHPLIHTAEGEFFRQAASKGCEDLQIPVTADCGRGELDGRVTIGVRERGEPVAGEYRKPWKPLSAHPGPRIIRLQRLPLR